MNEKQNFSPKLITDSRKAETMAYAEDHGRTNEAIARTALNIIEDGYQSKEYVGAINAATKKAEYITANSRDKNHTWDETKQIQAADEALLAWEIGLERNSTVLHSKRAEDYVTDSAARYLQRKAEKHGRSALKASKLAGRAYDKKQQTV